MPRPPFASCRMSCHTASGRQVRGCAKLNRLKAIPKALRVLRIKGDLRLSPVLLLGQVPDAHPQPRNYERACLRIRGFPPLARRRLRSRRCFTPPWEAHSCNCPNRILPTSWTPLCFSVHPNPPVCLLCPCLFTITAQTAPGTAADAAGASCHNP